MLQAIRDRAQGIFAWVMLILVGIPFALWGIQNYLDTGKEMPIATVGDREIFERDVNRVYEQDLASLVGLGQFDERQLKLEAVNKIIREELIFQNALDEGLVVSDEDARQVIQSLPYFQTDGKFDKDKYKLMISSQGMSPNQFAFQIRKSLVMEQYQKGLADTSFVTKQQLELFYRLRNQERSVEFVTVSPKKQDKPVSDAEIEAYYRDHQDEFRNPERVSVQYLAINLDDIANTIKPTDDEIKAAYDEQKSQYATAEKRKLSHILVAADIGKPEAEQAAKARADDIRKRLVAGEEFSKVAKEVSDDKDSAAKGGDLGFVNKETLDPNFASAAFALRQDELSEPVKTPFGYHLIKVTELTPAAIKPFEEVRSEIAKNLQRSMAENKFYELSQTLTEQCFEHPESLEPAAKALGLKIERTGWFTVNNGEGIASEAAVRKAAFAQDVLDGKNSEPVEIGSEKVYVLRLAEHEPSSVKPLDEVKTSLIGKLREQIARADAQKQAEKFVEDAGSGKSLADLAKSAGLQFGKPETIKRMGSKLPPALVEAAFNAPRPGSDGKVAVQRVGLDNGDQAVFQVLSVTDGKTEAVDPKELEMARDYLLKNTGQNEFGALIEQLRDDANVHVRQQAQE